MTFDRRPTYSTQEQRKQSAVLAWICLAVCVASITGIAVLLIIADRVGVL